MQSPLSDNSIQPADAGKAYDNLPEQLIASGPGVILLIDAQSGQILYRPANFAERLNIAPLQNDLSFFDLLETRDRERFRLQLSYAATDENAGNRHGSYQLKGQDGSHMWHIYTTVFNDAVEKFQLYLLPEVSKHAIPFLSYDSRELFFEQFQYLDFGTFEWIIGVDKVIWSEGIYHIYEIDSNNKDFNRDFVSKFTHAEDKERANNAVSEALAQGGGFSVEIRITTPTNKVKVIQTTGRVVSSADGSPVKLVGVIRDLTEQRRVEQDLKKHVMELNRSNKELEEFAYVASHDLQEPLRKITTFSGRLTEKYGDHVAGDGALYLERISVAAENMRTLINNLLEFSRVSRDTQPFETVNLGFVLRQVKADLELLIEETGATVEFSNMPVIFGSLTQMKQLFTNLINNSIKFRKADTAPAIMINSAGLDESAKLRRGLPPGEQYCEITLRDNGIGFDNEYSERIFQIFQRLNGKSEYPGSGIGLAICKKIVEHHKGVIFAEGTEGEGAMFTILLPLNG
jgi:signal transduction histidine kinase